MNKVRNLQKLNFPLDPPTLRLAAPPPGSRASPQRDRSCGGCGAETRTLTPNELGFPPIFGSPEQQQSCFSGSGSSSSRRGARAADGGGRAEEQGGGRKGRGADIKATQQGNWSAEPQRLLPSFLLRFLRQEPPELQARALPQRLRAPGKSGLAPSWIRTLSEKWVRRMK